MLRKIFNDPQKYACHILWTALTFGLPIRFFFAEETGLAGVKAGIHSRLIPSDQSVVSGPFYSFREAAAYCGYSHPDSFARMLREEDISLPACGPRRNRYARSILDAFMVNSDAYRTSRSVAGAAPCFETRNYWNEGNPWQVCQRKDGRWQVTYRDGEHVRSKPFPPGSEGKRQAKAFAADIAKRKALREDLVDAQQQTVYLQDLVQAWVETKKVNGLKQWVRDWVSVFNTVFLPALGTTAQLICSRRRIFWMSSTHHYGNHAQATRNRYIGYLKTAFNIGISDKSLLSSPLAKLKGGKETRHHSPLALEDLDRIIVNAPKHLVWAIQGRVEYSLSPPVWICSRSRSRRT